MSFTVQGRRTVTWLCFQIHLIKGRFLPPAFRQRPFLCQPEKVFVNCFHGTKYTSLLFTLQSPVNRSSSSSPDVNQTLLSPVQDNNTNIKLISAAQNGKNESCEISSEKLTKMSKILNCSCKETKMLADKFVFLHHIDPELLQEKVELILSYGIPYSVIHQDLRMLYNVSTLTLRMRLDLMRDHSLLQTKYTGYHLQCDHKDFQQSFENVYKNKQALEGCADQADYIQRRLNCSADKANDILSSFPFNRGYSSFKLKKLLDFFLLEANLCSQFMIQHLYLFTFSEDRLRHRLKIMNKAGIRDPNRMSQIWFYPTKTFKKILEGK